jgi:hypothetical protein
MHRWTRWTFPTLNIIFLSDFNVIHFLTNRTCVRNGLRDFSITLYIVCFIAYVATCCLVHNRHKQSVLTRPCKTFLLCGTKYLSSWPTPSPLLKPLPQKPIIGVYPEPVSQVLCLIHFFYPRLCPQATSCRYRPTTCIFTVSPRTCDIFPPQLSLICLTM